MLQSGTLLNDRYRIEGPVGEGGMATVYRAVDTRLGRTVAVKVLHPEYSRDRPFLQRFQQEAEFAASLGAHPNIVDIYDIGQDDGLHYIVMEFIEGSMLKVVIEQNRRLDVPQSFAIGQQVASALDFAHKRGLIHRDVKPQNILITPDGLAKVTDFGIARSVTASQLTRTGMVVGTVHYFSPEQAQGAQLGPASDIYSLGIVLYEMLTGHLPFDAENAVGIAMQHVHSEPPSPWDFNSDLPAKAVTIVMRALEKDPQQRYRDAAEFSSALASMARAEPSGTTTMHPIVERSRQRTATFQPVRPVVRDERVVATPRRTSVADETAPSGNRTRWMILLGILALVGLAVAAFFLSSSILGGSSTPATSTPQPTVHPTSTPKKSATARPTPRPTEAPIVIVPTQIPPTLALPPTKAPAPPTATPQPAPDTPKPRPTAAPVQTPSVEVLATAAPATPQG